MVIKYHATHKQRVSQLLSEQKFFVMGIVLEKPRSEIGSWTLREIELYVLSNVDTDESSFLSVAFREHMITRLFLANVLSYMNAKSRFLSNLTFRCPLRP